MIDELMISPDSSGREDSVDAPRSSALPSAFVWPAILPFLLRVLHCVHVTVSLGAAVCVRACCPLASSSELWVGNGSGTVIVRIEVNSPRAVVTFLTGVA